MSHQVRIIAAEAFLQTTVEGTIVFENSEQILRQIAEACRRYEQHRVLIDATRIPERSLSVIDLYQLGSRLQSYGFEAADRIGILCRAGESTHRAKFFELVAVNRGSSVRVFDKQDEAWAWLTEGGAASGNAAATNAPASTW